MRSDRKQVIITSGSKEIFVCYNGIVRACFLENVHHAVKLVGRLLWTGEYYITQTDSDIMRKACVAQGHWWTHPTHYISSSKQSKIARDL